jgi:hypothetical protein
MSREDSKRADKAHVCRDTGAACWTSAFDPRDDEVPDDLEISARYLAIPHGNDLDLERPLALRFVAQELPDQTERVAECFRHKGPYARFKNLLEAKGLLQQWYKFEANATDKALREWCAESARPARPAQRGH